MLILKYLSERSNEVDIIKGRMRSPKLLLVNQTQPRLSIATTHRKGVAHNCSSAVTGEVAKRSKLTTDVLVTTNGLRTRYRYLL